MTKRSRAALAFAVAALVCPIHESRAEEVAPIIYTVQAGDTCVGIATRFYGDKRFVDVIHAANPTMGPPPHALQAGTRLVIPAKPVDEGGKPDATVTRVRNKVEVTTTTSRPAKGNDPLFRGNRVGTKESSAADLTFRDETQVKLGEETLVVILGDTDARAARVSGTDMTLVTGELRARLSELTGKRPAEPRVTTDSGVVAMKAGEAKVSTDEKKTTRVAVYQGGSTLTAQKKSVAVNDGFGSKAQTGSPPTPPQPLPPPPDWEASAPAFVVATAPVEIAFSFAAASGASPAPASWHVQVARDASFDEIVVDQKTPLPVHRIEAKNLTSGTYFARVSAIDADLFEGKWGTVARTKVAVLALESGRDRHARLALEDGQLRCTVDGAPAAFPLEIDRDLPHSVACADETASGATAIPALPIGHAQLRVNAVALRERSGVLRVTLTDELGYGIARGRPIVAPIPDLHIDELREGETRGTYTGAFRWSARPRAVALAVHFRDDTVLASAPVDFPGQAARFAKTGGDVAAEVGVAAATSFLGAPPVGVGGEVEARLAIPTARGAMLFGGSGGWTKQLDAERGGVTVDASTIDMRALGGYRFGRGTISPYATLGPDVVRQHVERSGVETRQWLVGGAAAVGLDAAVGPGAFFLELRGRVVAAPAKEEPSLPASAGLLLFGYRLRIHDDDTK